MSHRTPSATTDNEGSSLDISTAPTTPDGSLGFSPVLQALKLQDALEGATTGQDKQRSVSRSLDSTLNSSRAPLKNICCVGAGYVGGPTAAVIAYQNPSLKVTVVDRDPSRIKQWETKHLPIFEPGLQDLVRVARDGSRASSFFNEASRPEYLDALSAASSSTSECESQCGEHRDEILVSARSPNLFFSTEISKHISEADIVLVAVNTPTKMRGVGAGRATDVTALEAVTKEIALHAKPGVIVVEKSTVPCKTAELIHMTLKAHRPDLKFEILSNPEFLAAGTAVKDLLHPDRVIIGSSPTASGYRAAETLAGVYASWVPRDKIITMNIWSSELSKLVANSMLAQRISSINSISAICERTGANVDEVALSIGLDPRIGDKFLKAGLGFGGSCFKKDILSLVYLAESLGLDEVGEYWQQVLVINDFQRTRFVRRVIKCLNSTLVGKKITMMGYAFKPNTNDTRESPALESIKAILEDGPAEIAVFDPCCNPAVVKEEIRRILGPEVLKEAGGPIVTYGDAYQACMNSHGVLIMTDCEEFRSVSSTKSPEQGRKIRKSAPVDPRPFQRLQPTESEVLTLHRFLSASSTDPLQWFEDEPACDAGCSKCVSEELNADNDNNSKRGERLDWAKLAYHLQTPKWVFDGRGVVDIKEMEALGIRVEAIGKVGSLGR